MKSDEGIFLGYSYKSKAYNCLNLSTLKIIESAHVRIDEFAQKSKEESNKEPKDYRKFIYYAPDTLPKERGVTTLDLNKLHIVQTKSQLVQPEIQSEGIESEATEMLPE